MRSRSRPLSEMSARKKEVSEMPGFDGTGPRGRGPMTGRGEGYCALVLPEPGRVPYGYAGLQGRPVGSGGPVAPPARAGFVRWKPPTMEWGRGFRRRRGRGARRGRGRRSTR
jgi:hypothetical protein